MLCVFTRPLHFFAIFDRNNCNKEKEITVIKKKKLKLIEFPLSILMSSRF